MEQEAQQTVTEPMSPTLKSNAAGLLKGEMSQASTSISHTTAAQVRHNQSEGPDPSDPDAPVELKQNLRPRFCSKCNQFKPPRSHHCSQCRRCILKMDHHCPWINNCVGYHNQAHFYRFVFHVVWTCMMIYLTLWKRLFSFTQEYADDLPKIVPFTCMLLWSGLMS